MKAVRAVLIVLHVLVGLNGLAGGYAAVSNPRSPFGISPEMIENSPFDSFLIPGIFLLVVIGGGNLAAAASYLLRRPVQGYASGAAGGILAAWIVVQCVMMRTVLPLHVALFLTGVVLGLLALALLARERMWPGTWATRILPRVFRAGA